MGINGAVLLPLYPVSKQWFKLLAERPSWGRTPWLTLVLNDSEQDLRRAGRALVDPSQHPTAFVACESELIAGGARAPVFQQCGCGFPNTPTIAPDAAPQSWPGSAGASPRTRGILQPVRTPTPTRVTGPMSERRCRSPQSNSTLHSAAADAG